MADNQIGEQREIKKRPRPVISCLLCRQKKLKCDRLLPCQQCLKGGRGHLCAYADGQEPELRQENESEDDPIKRARVTAELPKVTEIPTTKQVDDLIARVGTLERALQAQAFDTFSSLPDGHEFSGQTVDHGPGDNDDSRDTFPRIESDERPTAPFRITTDYINSLSGRVNDVDIIQLAAQTRAIDRALLRPRIVLRSLYSDPQDCIDHMLRILPDQKICETLISLYFDNFEHCSRVLRKPVFISQYRHSLTSVLDDIDFRRFVPLLIGVLSIASSLNIMKECDVPFMRQAHDGAGAIELLRNWLDVISDHEKLQLSSLQAKLLLLFVMKAQGHDDNSLWFLSGQLIREAQLMHLHIPNPSGVHQSEADLRRKLWTTILEQDFGNAICCGMPATTPKLIGPIPLNLNDDDLLLSPTAQFDSKPTTEWTDGLCQHILAQSYNARLDAYNFCLNCRPSQYELCLKMAKQLEDVIFNLPATFKLDQNNPPGRLMAQMEIDLTLRRPLIALYAPFAIQMPTDDRYREARIAWVQSNLVVLCFQDLFDPKFPVIEVPRPEGYWDLYYTLYRNDAIKGLRAELLELQRMRSPFHMNADDVTPNLQQHPHRSTSRALPWSIKGMIESIEDTLDPLVRRVGRDGADFGNVMRYQLAYETLRCEKIEEVDLAIRSGLKAILQIIHSRVEAKGFYIDASAILAGQDSVNALDNLQWLTEFLHGSIT